MEPDCVKVGGQYVDGKDCANAQCVPFEMGACCLAEGACEHQNKADCEAKGGSYSGDNSNCVAVTCGGTSNDNGACCFKNGSCGDDETALTCALQDGSYNGQGSSCATSNCEAKSACCLTGGMCSDLTQQACTQQDGVFNEFLGCNEVNCGAPNDFACCLTGGGCVVMDAAGCSDLGGTQNTSETTCGAETCAGPQVAACCIMNDCSMKIEPLCNDSNGSWKVGQACTDNPCADENKGACCFEDKPCKEPMSYPDCFDEGGDYQGDGSDCDNCS
jgi:hypothetical protein